jgi:hypothetical protein
MQRVEPFAKDLFSFAQVDPAHFFLTAGNPRRAMLVIRFPEIAAGMNLVGGL